MRKMKQMISCILLLCLVMISVIPQNVFGDEPVDDTCCNIDELSNVVSNYYNEAGNLVLKFDNGTEAEYFENGDVIIYDYAHVYSEGLGLSRAAVDWKKIGEIIYNIVTGGCTVVEWVSDVNPCEIFVQYILRGTGAPPASGRYIVGGTYHPGYIPGCEPRYSAPCNAGYWTYTYSKA